MSFSKSSVAIVFLAGFASFGCQTPRFQREFPPRVDHYLEYEFGHGWEGLQQTGGMFYDMTARDVANTGSNLTTGLVGFLGSEFTEHPSEMASSFSRFGANEWKNATKNFPESLADFFWQLFGI